MVKEYISTVKVVTRIFSPCTVMVQGCDQESNLSWNTLLQGSNFFIGVHFHERGKIEALEV